MIEIKDGNFHLIGNEKEARLGLMQYLNDNVFQNIDGIKEGAKRYVRDDQEVETKLEEMASKMRKEPLIMSEKRELSQEILNKTFDEQVKELNKAIDKILVRHRNTKVFLFMLTGPFFICFKVVSWTIKLIILLSLGKKM